MTYNARPIISSVILLCALLLFTDIFQYKTLSAAPLQSKDAQISSSTCNGTIFRDDSGDGALNLDEPRVPGVQVEIYDAAENLIGQTVTDGDGEWSIPGLPVGTVIRVQVKTPLPGSMIEGPIGSDSNGFVVLTNTDSCADLTFGALLVSACSNLCVEIGNRVWFDENGDGLQNANEPGIGGVTVRLYDSANQLVAQTQTDTTGHYLFTCNEGLEADTDYEIRLDEPNDYAANGPLDQTFLAPSFQGADPQLDSVATLVNGFPTITWTTGSPGSTAHFLDIGFNPPATIGDTVWHDVNGNGVQDTYDLGYSSVFTSFHNVDFTSLSPFTPTYNIAETGIPSVTVNLYTAGGDGVVGTGDDVLMLTTQTDAVGQYRFRPVQPGIPHRVEVDTSTLPSAMTASYDEDGPGDDTSVVPVLAPAQQHMSADFGYTGFVDLGISKTADFPDFRPRETIEWTVVVTNYGNIPAPNVAVADSMGEHWETDGKLDIILARIFELYWGTMIDEYGRLMFDDTGGLYATQAEVEAVIDTWITNNVAVSGTDWSCQLDYNLVFPAEYPINFNYLTLPWSSSPPNGYNAPFVYNFFQKKALQDIQLYYLCTLNYDLAAGATAPPITFSVSNEFNQMNHDLDGIGVSSEEIVSTWDTTPPFFRLEDEDEVNYAVTESFYGAEPFGVYDNTDEAVIAPMGDLEWDKRLVNSADAPFDVGEDIIWEITITNVGTVPWYENILMRDVVGVGSIVQSPGAPWICTPVASWTEQVECAYPKIAGGLAPGDSVTATIVSQFERPVFGSDVPSVRWINRAQAIPNTHTAFDDDTANNSDTAAFTVATTSWTVSKDEAQVADGVLEWTINHNVIPADVPAGQSVVIQEQLPPNSPLLSVESAGWQCELENPTLAATNPTAEDVNYQICWFTPISTTVTIPSLVIRSGFVDGALNTACPGRGVRLGPNEWLFSENEIVCDGAPEFSGVPVTPTDMAITKSHDPLSEPWIRGSTGVFTLTISELGVGPDFPVIEDILQPGLELVDVRNSAGQSLIDASGNPITGTGWICVSNVLTNTVPLQIFNSVAVDPTNHMFQCVGENQLSNASDTLYVEARVTSEAAYSVHNDAAIEGLTKAEPKKTTDNSPFWVIGDDGTIDNDTEDDVPVPAPDLQIEKSHTAPAFPGVPFDFTITITNNSDFSAIPAGNMVPIAGPLPLPVHITDTFPFALEYVGFSGTDWTCSSDGASPPIVSCSYGTAGASLPAGQAAPPLTITALSPNPGLESTTNSVAVWTDISPIILYSLTPDYAREDVDFTIPAVEATKTSSQPQGVVGDPATDTFDFFLNVENTGSGAALAPVRITDTMPTAFNINGITPDPDWDCSASSGQQIDCLYTAGTGGAVDLPSGANDTVTVNVTLDANAPAGPVGNTMYVSHSGTQALPEELESTRNINILRYANTAVSKVRDITEPQIGDVIAYTVVVTNTGPSSAQGVEVIDFLPIGTFFVDTQGTDPAWSCINDNGAPEQITCSLAGDLAVGNAPPLIIRMGVTAKAMPGISNFLAIQSNTESVPGYTVQPYTIDEHISITGCIGDYVWWDQNGDGNEEGMNLGADGVIDTLDDLFGLNGPGPDGIFGNTDDAPVGFENATLNLDWAGPDNIFGTVDDMASILTTTTNIDGYYAFEFIPTGLYSVSVDTNTGNLYSSTLPLSVFGATFDLDSGIATPNSTSEVAVGGASPMVRNDVDFGYKLAGVIGDTVWFDENRNGIQESNETGIPNVVVELEMPDGTTITTTTSLTGTYLFDELPFGTYTVTVDSSSLPSTLVQTFDDNGPLDHTSTTMLTPLAPEDMDQDFGYVYLDFGDLPNDYNTAITNTNAITPAHHSIVDGVYLGSIVDAEIDGQPSTNADGDDNNITGANGDDEDGVLFTSNPLGDPILLAGQPFTLTVTASTAGYLNAWFDWNNDGDLTDADENPFADTALITGTNTITMTVPAGMTADDIYSRFRFSSDDPAGTMEPDGFWPNGEVEDYMTPAIERFSLGNRIWEDKDNDGTWNDATESGIKSVIVNLLDIAGTVIATTTTDATGYYLFDDLPTGDYVVEVDAANFGAGQPLENQQSSTGAGQEADPNSDVDSNDNGLDTPVAGGVRSAVVTLSSAASNSGTGEPSGETDLGPNEHGTATDIYSNLTVDFGFFEPVTVGNRVWYDLDNNGSQDVGEMGVVGVDVTLYDAATNTVVTVNADGNAITPLTTDVTGHYTFTNLIPGDYYVVFDQADIPSGYDMTTPSATGVTDEFDSDANETTGQSDSTGYLASGEESLNLDMGIYPLASIGDTVWFDNDHDGIYEPGENEKGVEGIDVVLYDATAGTPVMTTTTNINGSYLFTNLVPGDYYVDFDLTDLPTGYTVTHQDVATDPTDASDSDADPNTGETHVVTLGPGDSNLTLDMGIYARVSVGDRVWYDDDYDGMLDTSEAGVLGVDVTLYDATTDMIVTMDADGSPITPQTTDGNGFYSFNNLPPGNYYVIFDLTDLPAGYQVTKQDNLGANDSDDSDADPATGQSGSTGMLLATQADMTLDMGIWTTVTVGDTVWYDNNGNGIQDDPADEPGVENVTVTLLDSTGTPLTDVSGNPITTMTNASGYYEFVGLIPGSYAVAFDASTLPAGYGPTTANAGDDALDSDADLVTLVTPATDFLLGGESDMTLDLGILAPVSLGDTVWYDNDRDGVQDNPADEPGVPNVTVNLLDGSGNPVLDGSGSPLTTVTNSDGLYEFTNLPPGEYMIDFDLTSLPAGYVPTAPNQSGDETTDSDASASTGRTAATDFLNATERDETLDMGIIQLGEVRVGDTVWEDLNANGLQDAGEPGVENVLVTLYHADGRPTGLMTLTDPDGFYLFDELEPGDYYVEFSLNTLPNGYQVTTQDAGDDSLDSDVDPTTGQTPATAFLNDGEQDLSLDLGIWTPASLGDIVWLDSDADGIQEAGEDGIANVTVNLLDGNGNPVLDANGNPRATVTDANGNYEFTGLMPSDYIVEFVAPTGHTLTQQDAGGDDTADSDADPTTGRSSIVTLQSGEHNPTIDAGVHEPTSIGNYVWEDLNADGLQESGEPGVENVTVRLYDGEGNLVDTMTTDTNGFYGFNGLTPGDYYVEVVPPTGMILTLQDAGGDDVADSDADPTTGLMPVTTLDSGEDDPTWDAGLVRPASIGDTAWLDENGNGLQDADEPGVESVTVVLYDESGSEVARTVTDSDGHYEFTNLLPGEYSVGFEPPAGYSITDQNMGSDNALDSDADTNGSTPLVTLAPGEHNPTIDVGLIRSEIDVGSIGDTIFHDANRDGLFNEDDDFTLPSVVVMLTDSSGNTLTTTTDVNGNYLFENLPLDATYTVTVDTNSLPPNVQTDPTFDPDGGADSKSVVTLTSSSPDNRDQDFGYPPGASVGQWVWLDANKDGIRDSNEPGVNGVTVTLRNANGDVVAITTTEPSGYFEFVQLIPGEYSLEFDPPSDMNFTEPDVFRSGEFNSDADPETGRTGAIRLEPGENDLEWGAGLVQVDPTAIVLSSFTVSLAESGDAIIVHWRTSAELDTYGFHVLRSSDGAFSNAEIVTDRMIISQGSAGSSYEVVLPYNPATDPSLEQGTFWLSEIEVTDVINYYGPATITVDASQLDQFMYLPFLSQ